MSWNGSLLRSPAETLIFFIFFNCFFHCEWVQIFKLDVWFFMYRIHYTRLYVRTIRRTRTYKSRTLLRIMSFFQIIIICVDILVFVSYPVFVLNRLKAILWSFLYNVDLGLVAHKIWSKVELQITLHISHVLIHCFSYWMWLIVKIGNILFKSLSTIKCQPCGCDAPTTTTELSQYSIVHYYFFIYSKKGALA
jgi:hypothetical protein